MVQPGVGTGLVRTETAAHPFLDPLEWRLVVAVGTQEVGLCSIERGREKKGMEDGKEGVGEMEGVEEEKEGVGERGRKEGEERVKEISKRKEKEEKGRGRRKEKEERREERRF